MQKIAIVGLVVLGCVLPVSAQLSKLAPAEASVRFSEQISNGPAGTCGCFAMEGIAGDVAWSIHRYGMEHNRVLGGVADVSVEHTGKVSNAPYGLTLTTLAFGPRYATAYGRSHFFAQSLFGFSHGSGSEFPQHNSLVPSASSFVLAVGAGADYPIRDRVSIRLGQIEYLRSSLPNNSTNWQNNLRIGARITFHIAH
jgi:hypothetical protein